MVKTRERKILKDKIIKKLEPYVFGYLLDDDFTRLDTKQGLVDVIDPRSETGELVTVHRRIWLNANKRQRHVLFQESEHYAKFQRENGNKTAEYDVFRRVCNKIGSRFVTKPTTMSCVDTKIVGLEHMYDVSIT